MDSFLGFISWDGWSGNASEGVSIFFLMYSVGFEILMRVLLSSDGVYVVLFSFLFDFDFVLEM